ncbi:SDR family oxidoreductase [Pontibacter akesuensis]|uniref:NAD(P)-dependent dehydrogenase, short-chain alcohol dehydrogenase family n=1 Tax=Pontibacter akesuensis TaxID=388950 RepID=A0A1I7K964_9BACT|nr:SDR family oxidoreductase [Pontibacter akesuensis]GHA74106.1 short chain dehydrogenase [Pontibacter akesuensis]SFU93958.1 NAD(P)-dependent dehydrogenase, short-chain alcohol dehydrogenase family [Pontibacter akesuensis]
MQTGKVILVVGGTSGIGSATAQLAAERGYTVVIAGRDPQKAAQVMKAIKEKGALAHFLQTDISDSRQVAHLVDEVVRLYGRMDAACNSAALDEGVGVALADVEEEAYDYQMGVNLKGIWLCMKYQIRQMLKQGGGSLVNVSSINGLGGAQGASIYSAAKSGMLGLTKSAAQEYATAGIRINALCAGAFKTPMLENVFKKANPDNPSQVEEQYKAFIPMQRIGHPSEAAEAILWLLSDQASYITGHSMIIDGGFSSSFR